MVPCRFLRMILVKYVWSVEVRKKAARLLRTGRQKADL